MEKCLECGLCKENCLLLAELGESPKRLAERGIAAGEAFSCALCGGCEAACPAGLSPKELFAAARRAAVATGDFDLNEYRYLFPDRQQNIMNVYREFYGIDYRDIEARGHAATCFFPGCTLMTYAPGLTRKVYGRLRDSCGCEGVLGECCGKPLSQLGLWQRADNAAGRLLTLVQAHNVHDLIVACPGCYYELRQRLSPAGVHIRTVYEALDWQIPRREGNKLCTVHDSCPDRFEGVFGRQVRDLLERYGFPMAAMAHSKQNTICCGSGGMISHFRPDLTEKLVGLRLDAAQQSGAEILVSYCISCVLKFAAKANGFSVAHALDLLLGRHEDFTAAKKKVAEMLEGPRGAEIWARIMAD